MTSLTRRYRFSASHRLHSAQLNEQENARLYGKCNNPFGHGHDYVLEVSASGEVDERTGLLLSLAELDELVEREVLQLFRYRNLNLDLPYFTELVPTTEHIALVIAKILGEKWTAYVAAASARLARVHIQETDRNSFEVRLGSESGLAQSAHLESVQLHA
jgi:6-pyruvoyltetrahydropterin/6-carboxytetrahydropterin synthase